MDRNKRKKTLIMNNSTFECANLKTYFSFFLFKFMDRSSGNCEMLNLIKLFFIILFKPN
jgi:hypothetical protein